MDGLDIKFWIFTMKMLQVKSGKSTYRYRLDWIVSWHIVRNPEKGKKTETWDVKLRFLEPGTYQLTPDDGKALRWLLEPDFNIDNEADAMASVSVVDI